MNPIDFEFKAEKAIDAWKLNHKQKCLLVLDGDAVTAVNSHRAAYIVNYNLLITRSEVEHGLTPSRWSRVGCALHYIWNKEKKCPHTQKLLL